MSWLDLIIKNNYHKVDVMSYKYSIVFIVLKKYFYSYIYIYIYIFFLLKKEVKKNMCTMISIINLVSWIRDWGEMKRFSW